MSDRIKIGSVPVQGVPSADAKIYQHQLNVVGGFKLAEDGIPGPKTIQATKDFQKKMIPGSTGTGVIGPMTLKLLGLEVEAVNPVTGGTAITKKLSGSGRTLHPTLRLMLENKIFPGGIIPAAWKNGDLTQMAKDVMIALESMGIKEVGGNNRGEKVGFIQGIIGGYIANGNGDAWCASTGQVIVAFIEDFLQIKSPVVPGEGVTECYAQCAKVPGLTTQKATAGSFAAAQHGSSWQGHWMNVFEVLANGKMKTFEGNTGDENARDGDGAYWITRDQKQNGDLKTLGFIFIYPNNKIPTKAA